MIKDILYKNTDSSDRPCILSDRFLYRREVIDEESIGEHQKSIRSGFFPCACIEELYSIDICQK